MLLVLWGVYVVVFASAVTTDAEGITAQNYLRRTRVPWGAVEDIDLRYQLVITTRDGGRLTCFGGPVSGRPGRLSRSAGDDEARRVPSALREVDRIRAEWDDARERGAADGAVTRSWDLAALVALLVLVVAAVVATVIAAA
ncbi:PH domain-containing protein [Microbacterium sp. 18062]|uniref:PH domain-containing protein n=1 Tax=Microbacterium sp. 18062 TaxID=2681410 RepID=UPI0013581D2C|nr:PH domain-containing protein [Microbacterium sp. 18062]